LTLNSKKKKLPKKSDVVVASYDLPPDSQRVNKQKSLEKNFEPLMGIFVCDTVNKRLILQYEGKPCIKGRDATHPTRQINTREHMSLKNITIRTPLIH
jgi:hypothetical protein